MILSKVSMDISFRGHFPGRFRRNSLKYPLCRISALQYLPYPLPSLPPLDPPRSPPPWFQTRLYLSLDSFSSFSRISSITTSAPSGEFQCHRAPMPLAAPVTIAVFPLKLSIVSNRFLMMKFSAAPKAAVTHPCHSGGFAASAHLLFFNTEHCSFIFIIKPHKKKVNHNRSLVKVP